MLLLLVEMLLFAMAFTRKCHTKHSGIKGHSQGRAPGSSNQDEHSAQIQSRLHMHIHTFMYTHTITENCKDYNTQSQSVCCYIYKAYLKDREDSQHQQCLFEFEEVTNDINVAIITNLGLSSIHREITSQR